MVEVCIVQDNKCVAPPQFHCRFLKILSGTRSDRFACSLGASEGDTLDARVIDQQSRLVIGQEEVCVDALREASILKNLLESDCTLWHPWRVLKEHDISGHKVRPDKPSQLIVGIVPRLNAEEYSNGGEFQMGIASLGMKRFRNEEAFGILCKVLQNRRAKIHFSSTLPDEFAHFECRKPGKRFFPLQQEFGSIVHHGRALGDGRCGPRAECSHASIKRRQHIFIRMFSKGFEHFSGSWIDAAIWHIGTPCSWISENRPVSDRSVAPEQCDVSNQESAKTLHIALGRVSHSRPLPPY